MISMITFLMLFNNGYETDVCLTNLSDWFHVVLVSILGFDKAEQNEA